MEKILVTGGAGFIGAHLTEKLVNLKYQVMVVDSLETIGGIPHINPKCKFIKGSITSENILSKIKRWRPRIIFHLAAQSCSETAYDNPKKDYLTNGYGTYLLALLAKEVKASQFIYSSSVAVYGSNPQKKITEKSTINPDSIYGISKHAGEMFVKQILHPSKVKTRIFRIFNTYGPGEDLNFLRKGMVSIFVSYVWKNKPIIVKGSLNRFRNFNYIDDCVNILVNSIKNKNLKKDELFNLSAGKSFAVKKLINEILKTSNKRRYKIVVKNGTPGDSFGYHASNTYLLKKFKNYKFLSLKAGLKKYLEWIKKVPNKREIKNFHPLKIKKKNKNA
jgi:UDP-glucose 4-epimerase